MAVQRYEVTQPNDSGGVLSEADRVSNNAEISRRILFLVLNATGVVTDNTYEMGIGGFCFVLTDKHILPDGTILFDGRTLSQPPSTVMLHINRDRTESAQLAVLPTDVN